MRTLQYKDRAGRIRLGVLSDDGHDVVDVSDQLDAGESTTGFLRLIARARIERTSPERILLNFRRHSSHVLTVDWDRHVLVDGAATYQIVPPISAPEVWAAGVSYRRSREAREAESGADGREIYTRVYDAERPELFIKDAGGRRTVGTGASIQIRHDSSWSVPEPELALILDRNGTIVAYTLGDDVSARDIEAENPLYLPQAKVFGGACALGPTALLAGATEPAFDIALRIFDSKHQPLFEGATSTAEMRRSFGELISYLRRDNPIDDGTVLLTGTGIVPPDDFALEPGHVVEIETSQIGLLRNPVTRSARAEQGYEEVSCGRRHYRV